MVDLQEMRDKIQKLKSALALKDKQVFEESRKTSDDDSILDDSS